MTFRDNNGEVHEADLLPCPFCGGEPALQFIGNNATKTRKVTISCKSCRVKRTDAARMNGFDWLFLIALDHWNNRATAHAPEVGA